MSTYVIGVDLGQAQDYTAVAVAEVVLLPEGRAFHRLQHLERYPLGMSYPAMADRLVALASHEYLAGQVTLAVDATGVGRPVVDLLRQLTGVPLIAVTMTGGDQVTREGLHFHVPKRTLVSTLAVAVQTGRVKARAEMPFADEMARELASFQVSITEAANDTYSASGRAHDDLVMALALEVWAGECAGGQAPAFIEAWRRMAARA